MPVVPRDVNVNNSISSNIGATCIDSDINGITIFSHRGDYLVNCYYDRIPTSRSEHVLTNIRHQNLNEFREDLEELLKWIDPVEKMKMKNKLIEISKIINRVILYA